jgi:hypothetical protein
MVRGDLHQFLHLGIAKTVAVLETLECGDEQPTGCLN